MDEKKKIINSDTHLNEDYTFEIGIIDDGSNARCGKKPEVQMDGIVYFVCTVDLARWQNLNLNW